MMLTKLLLDKELDDAGILSIRMFSKLWHCRIILFLFARFKTIILCSVHFIWFVKCVFSTKMRVHKKSELKKGKIKIKNVFAKLLMTNIKEFEISQNL